MVRLRPARLDELPRLSALCLRSKAVWGYDAAFLDLCRDELIIRPEDLRETEIVVAEEQPGGVIGVAQLSPGDPATATAELSKLFIEPTRQGRGVGRALVSWAMDTARAAGAAQLSVEADPGAAPFYGRLGAREIGRAPSASGPDRWLPVLIFDLVPDQSA